MIMEDLLLTKLRTLAPMQQQEVLDFVEFLAHRPGYSLDRVSGSVDASAAPGPLVSIVKKQFVLPIKPFNPDHTQASRYRAP